MNQSRVMGNMLNLPTGELEAVMLRSGWYAVRPVGQLGTCGSYPYLWTVKYVKAKSAEDAVKIMQSK